MTLAPKNQLDYGQMGLATVEVTEIILINNLILQQTVEFLCRMCSDPGKSKEHVRQERAQTPNPRGHPESQRMEQAVTLIE